jgi:hypothetical protein
VMSPLPLFMTGKFVERAERVSSSWVALKLILGIVDHAAVVKKDFTETVSRARRQAALASHVQTRERLSESDFSRIQMRPHKRCAHYA